MAKRISTRGVGKDRIYEYAELAAITGLTTPTIRRMRDHGLRVMTEKKPHLILGADFIEYAKRRRAPTRGPMEIDQFHCLRCREPVRPDGMAVDYHRLTEKRGRLLGFCERCGAVCNRFVAAADLPVLRNIFELAEGCGQ